MNQKKNSVKLIITVCVLIVIAIGIVKSGALEYLKDNSLDKWTQNKAIQKIRESFRVSEEDKELVKSLKK